ncbi:MAG: glycoside hydrolase family 15 protein [Spirochaetales bacterium]
MQENLNYGIIGNCRSAALVSQSGSIDWCCLPDFNSPSIFAALLDEEEGGRFAIEALDLREIKQEYFSQTNILRTRFVTKNGSFDVYDFMPRYHQEGTYHVPPEIVRYIHYVEGTPKLRVHYDPRLGYARYRTKNEIHLDYIKSYTEEGRYESIYLYSSFDLRDVLEGGVLELTSDGFFLLSYNQKLIDMTVQRIRLEYERTKVYWMNWVDRTFHYTYATDAIIRSALTLKMLTYQKSGAIIAAVTTSLPEVIGEQRNWDYRFCWIRDASMIVNILMNLGHSQSVHRFLKFILDIVPYKDEKIQIMYGINGEKNLEEKELSWLSGYMGSRPVRIGNAAYLQKQNDIFGVLLDVLYQYFRFFRNSLSNSEDLWSVVRTIARSVEANWKKPDRGIWEYRNSKQHFVFSKVLSWTAIDRAMKIAQLFGKKDLEERWKALREVIRKDIYKKGWNPELQAFTQYYGSTNMDAANLLMPTYGFIDPMDPKYVSTVHRIRDELLRDGLMYRYKAPDDFGEPRTAFTICTFWLIKSLYQIGEQEEAKALFETVLQYSNHLGLFSEGIDFTTKRLMGNFPQGYSHLALIDTAITLSGKQVEETDRLFAILRRSFT